MTRNRNSFDMIFFGWNPWGVGHGLAIFTKDFFSYIKKIQHSFKEIVVFLDL